MTQQPGRLERILGGPPLHIVSFGQVAADGTVDSWEVPAEAIGPLSITRGRQDIDSRPEPTVLQLELVTELLPRQLTLGDYLLIYLTDATLAYLGSPLLGQPGQLVANRFGGNVSDLVAKPKRRRDAAATIAVTAVGPKAKLGQIDVGAVAYPAENDGARAARLLAEVQAQAGANNNGAGGVLTVTADPGVYQLLPTTAQVTTAASAFDQLALDSGGELAEIRGGGLRWYDAASRNVATTLVELTAANAMAPSSWQQKVNGLLNKLTLTYGSPAASIVVTDDLSRAQVGRYAAEQTTQLALASEAGSRATELVGRRSTPRWRLPGLALDMLRTLTPAQAKAVAQHHYGERISLAGFPTTGPIVSGLAYIEGSTEVWTRDSWQIALAVSDYPASGPAPRYADIPGYVVGTPPARWDWRHRRWVYPGVASTGITYAQLATDPLLGGRTYLQMYGASFGDPGRARYIDQPADLRFYTEPATLTYATAT